MFEDSLITSAISPDQKRNAKRTRWIALTSVAIQATVLTTFIVVPLMWPETLPLINVAPKMTSLTMKKPEVKIQPKPVPVVSTDNAYHPSQLQQMIESRGSSVLRQGSSIALAVEEPALPTGMNMGGGKLPGFGIGDGTGSGPIVVAATPKSATPLAISSGVSKGMLLAPIQPVYPRIAVQARVEGTVIVTATIDKHGRITGLQVVSGPEMLRNAAADAIRDARYHPYMLNGEPTDVITTISVNFRLAS